MILVAQELLRLVLDIHSQIRVVERQLVATRTHQKACVDVRQQICRLIHPNYVLETKSETLKHFPRYLKAAALRLDKLLRDPMRDIELQGQVARLEADWFGHKHLWAEDQDIKDFGWILEELRVAVFAQELRTPQPMSVKRASAIWKTLISRSGWVSK